MEYTLSQSASSPLYIHARVDHMSLLAPVRKQLNRLRHLHLSITTPSRGQLEEDVLEPLRQFNEAAEQLESLTISLHESSGGIKRLRLLFANCTPLLRQLILRGVSFSQFHSSNVLTRIRIEGSVGRGFDRPAFGFVELLRWLRHCTAVEELYLTKVDEWFAASDANL